MNDHNHWFTEFWTWVLIVFVTFLMVGFSLGSNVNKKHLVEQQILCVNDKGIIYQQYKIYFLEHEDMRFMIDKEYQEYCTPHAGSVERKPK